MAYKDLEKKRAYMRKWHKQWRANNREKHRQFSKNWYEANKEKQREYELNKFRTDPNYKLARLLRARLNKIIKHVKTGSAVQDLGCSIPEFRMYVEQLWKSGMTWENYGSEWHLDHIKPLASFDLSDRAQFLEACNWKNLQPLWAMENLVKGKKVA